MALAVAGAAHGQTYRQFHDELYCHDAGYYTAMALQDYRNGVPLETALARDDGYLCTDHSDQICEIKRNDLKGGTRLVYSQLGPQADVRNMDAARFANFADMASTGVMQQCLQGVRH
jgi:hypothetical protein